MNNLDIKKRSNYQNQVTLSKLGHIVKKGHTVTCKEVLRIHSIGCNSYLILTETSVIKLNFKVLSHKICLKTNILKVEID